MTVRIFTLICFRCGAEMRLHSTQASVRPDPCPICLTDTVIVTSSRPMHDPIAYPDRRDY